MQYLFLLLFLFFSACVSTTQTGRSQIMMMSESEELKLGAQSAQEVLSSSKISKNQTQTNQVVRVGKKIAQVANKPEYKWEFYLLEDKSVNAFCLPGGKIFVYTGLMGIIANDDELATVMGHEVAHALLRHGAERVSMNKVQSTVGAILDVGMAVAAPNYRNAANTAYNLGSTYGVTLPYGRSHELEADKLGIELMRKAGYNPQNAVNFWQKMSTQSGKTIEFLSTHPSDEKRIKQIQEIIKN